MMVLQETKLAFESEAQTDIARIVRLDKRRNESTQVYTDLHEKFHFFPKA